MDNVYRELFRGVSHLLFWWSKMEGSTIFSVGSVILSEPGDKDTFILTHHSMLASHSAPSFTVRFSDGHKQAARFAVGSDPFCILRTDFYPKGKALQFFNGEIDNVHAAVVAPASSCSVYNLPGFVIQKSAAAGGDKPGELVGGYEHVFVVACRYGDCLPSGRSRLLSGPVFNLDGKVLGMVLSDLGTKKKTLISVKNLSSNFHSR